MLSDGNGLCFILRVYNTLGVSDKMFLKSWYEMAIVSEGIKLTAE